VVRREVVFNTFGSAPRLECIDTPLFHLLEIEMYGK
jgi:hypothetical protein